MRVVNVVIAIAFGLLVLLGYFFPSIESFQNLQASLLSSAMILAGAAALAGILNLISVHADKIRRREKNTPYSLILLIALIGTFSVGLVLGPGHELMQIAIQGVIVPAEATLMALLAVTLLYAAIRLLRRRVDMMSIVFLVTAVLILLGTATLPFGNIPVLGDFRQWLTEVLAVGGARGILIGVALGILTTGLRILFGWDRPYGGK